MKNILNKKKFIKKHSKKKYIKLIFIIKKLKEGQYLPELPVKEAGAIF